MKKRVRHIISFLILLAVGYILIPEVGFDRPYSKVMFDKDNDLLGGKIAEDGQWRFPKIDSVPQNFEAAILTFEDKRFYSHPGIDLRAFARATKQNLKEKRIVSGASTLSMQVCRLSQKSNERTLGRKLIEMLMALKLELTADKKEILDLYASHAPFGGNVVGLEAASWRYYGKSPELLSQAEAALLAVLPNAPALIHPGKNRRELREKRDRLLKKMLQANYMDQLDYELALMEPIPERPQPLPRIAPHLLEHLRVKTTEEARLKTTIDSDIQKQANQSAKFFTSIYQENDIQNMGILIMETVSGKIVGYVGNSPNAQSEQDVDMVQAKRSSGSILKPFLYALSLDEGLIRPKGLLPDVPTYFDGYRPQNYNKAFDGAVKADEALARSLNVPAVNLLQKYTVGKFKSALEKLGFTTINKSTSHYGLTLILGTGDIKLAEVTSAYASLGRILMRYKNDQSRYCGQDVFPASCLNINRNDHSESLTHNHSVVTAGAIHHTLNAMKKVSRPDEEGGWQNFNSSKIISWKTGTSYGHKDAWAVGVSPKYTVGVWVGNADGEGRHNLVGVKKAAPVLFDLFNKLDGITTFPIPYDDLKELEVCAVSGLKASKHCIETTQTLEVKDPTAQICPYHKKIHVDANGLRVHRQCGSPSKMKSESHFVLPPEMAMYYRQSHLEYADLPKWNLNCLKSEDANLISFIYPTEHLKIYLPEDGSGERNNSIFKASHQNPNAKLYWHLDESYLGMTSGEHNMAITSKAGLHKVTVMDEDGNASTISFEMVAPRNKLTVSVSF